MTRNGGSNDCEVWRFPFLQGTSIALHRRDDVISVKNSGRHLAWWTLIFKLKWWRSKSDSLLTFIPMRAVFQSLAWKPGNFNMILIWINCLFLRFLFSRVDTHTHPNALTNGLLTMDNWHLTWCFFKQTIRKVQTAEFMANFQDLL